MLTPQELEWAGMLLDPQMHELEERIMSDIIRRIRINGEITSSADWQIHRLYELGMSKREIKKIIKETLDLSPAEISHMYKQVLRSGYARSRELYKEKGSPWIPFDKNTGLQQLINAVSVQTAGTLQNITQSLGFATRVGGKLAYLPIADYYQKTLDAAMYDIASGAFDYSTVLKRTVREMTNSGLRTIDYASGWANRVEVAARRAIMTGMGQLTSKINEDNAKALETDWFEITWHSGFRPEHDWGGKWFRRPDLVRVCGLGSVTGLCGANCYHDYYPVIPGISVPLYTDEQLKAMNEAEQKPVEWKGKTYTKYEATQRQRALETTMRAQRQEMQLLKEGGADEDDLINLRARYRATSQEYVRFSEAAGLPQQRERVSIDGLGNIMQGKYTGGSGKESPVRVPPVGAKRGTPVPDAARAELLEHPRMVLTNPAQSGIMNVEHKMGAPKQLPPDFSLYEVKEDPDAVEAVKKMMVEELGIPEDEIDLSGIKNAEVLEPFMKRWKRIQEETGMKFLRVQAVEIIDSDPTCVAGLSKDGSRFYISSKYFNSKEALLDTLKAWAGDGIMPKQCKSIAFIAEHEAAHIRIPDSLLETVEAKKIWKRRKLDNENDEDIYEYFADITAIFRMNRSTSDTSVINAVEFLRNGGVLV